MLVAKVLIFSVVSVYVGVTVCSSTVGILHKPVARSLHPQSIGCCMLDMLAFSPSKIVTLSNVKTVT